MLRKEENLAGVAGEVFSLLVHEKYIGMYGLPRPRLFAMTRC